MTRQPPFPRWAWAALVLVVILVGGACASKSGDESAENLPPRQVAAVTSCTGVPGPDEGRDLPTDCLSGGGGAISADFNSDQASDLAIGVPHKDVDGVVDAGAVYIFFGGAAFTGQAPQVFTQGSDGVDDKPEAGDQFGFSLTAVTVDCNDQSDLLVGVPFEDVDEAKDAGAFHVLFGTRHGKMVGQPPDPIVRTRSFWTQDSGDLREEVESGDLFGYSFAWALTAFAPDPHHIAMAVGAPGEDLDGGRDAGAVHVLHNDCGKGAEPERLHEGSGLTDVDSQFWHQDSTAIADAVEDGDGFGTTLAFGGFSHVRKLGVAGPSALVIGVPGEDGSGQEDSGVVHVLPPAGTMVTGAGSQVWDQGALREQVEADDRFGEEITTRDLNGDGFSDLIVGVPREDLRSEREEAVVDAGVVHIVYSAGSAGLSEVGSEILTQATASGDADPQIRGVEEGDMFGGSLASGNFNADSFGDLAIGAPYEDLDDIPNAGVVHVLLGGEEGIAAPKTTVVLRQDDTPGQISEEGDLFGFALSAWNYSESDPGGTTPTDLAIGIPFQDVGVVRDAGAIMVFFGSADGVARHAEYVLTADAVRDAGSEEGARFGTSLY